MSLVVTVSNDHQVPYYLGEMIEKIAQNDRIQILKTSQAKLKVNNYSYYDIF